MLNVGSAKFKVFGILRAGFSITSKTSSKVDQQPSVKCRLLPVTVFHPQHNLWYLCHKIYFSAMMLVTLIGEHFPYFLVIYGKYSDSLVNITLLYVEMCGSLVW